MLLGLLPLPAAAETRELALGFSSLRERLDGGHELGFAKDEPRGVPRRDRGGGARSRK